MRPALHPSSSAAPTATGDVTLPLAATWPAERFYWSVLDVPAATSRRWRRAGSLPIGLRPAFDEDVPLSIDPDGDSPLHAVCAPLGADKVVVCAVTAATLRELGAGTLALTPEGLPAFIAAELTLGERPMPDAVTEQPDIALARSLNLLVGEFEPRVFRGARARRRTLVLAALLALCVIAIFGLNRRSAHDREFAQQAKERVAELARSAGSTLGVTTTKLEALAGLRARAQQSADAAARIAEPADGAAALAALLTAWPRGAACSPQSINASGNTVAISVSIEGDAAGFLRSLTPALEAAGWTLEEPRLTSVRGVTRLNLALRRGSGRAEP